MNKQAKKYIRKRKMIIDILLDIEVEYNNLRAEIYTTSNMSENQALIAAEKILNRFGMSKPSELDY